VGNSDACGSYEVQAHQKRAIDVWEVSAMQKCGLTAAGSSSFSTQFGNMLIKVIFQKY
jgi:hypothetical protein